jgi:hypothetical protein
MKTTNKKTKKKRNKNVVGKDVVGKDVVGKDVVGKDIVGKDVVGGKALTSGGFGCLFKPALKCKNTLNYDKLQGTQKMVTKLMTKRHAKDEYMQITKFKSILDHIPNYRKYFLVDGFSICEPAELSVEDLEEFDDNCSALKKKHFKQKNINQNLNKILALNMPDGGIDVDDYILNDANKTNLAETYYTINNSLVDLLVNGIVPMNQANLYHCDVKGSNILVSKEEDEQEGTTLNTRLIDWGLSINKKDTAKNSIPDKLERRPFQFNVPFSVILFNKKFIEKYDRFLKRHQSIDFFAIREFVINYIFYWNKIRGSGHLKTINSIMKRLTYDELPAIENRKVKNHVIEYDFTYYYIVEYISNILFKYTVDGKLKLLDYFNNVFLKNIDIWGLTMIYMVFLDNLYKINQDENQDENQNQTLNIYQMKFIDKIKYIIIHFLFENSTEIIDINKLAGELQSLNDLITKFDTINQPQELKGVKETEGRENYLLSLTEIESDDIKGIGGKLIKPNKGNQTNKIFKTKTKTNKTRNKRRSRL